MLNWRVMICKECENRSFIHQCDVTSSEACYCNLCGSQDYYLVKQKDWIAVDYANLLNADFAELDSRDFLRILKHSGISEKKCLHIMRNLAELIFKDEGNDWSLDQ